MSGFSLKSAEMIEISSFPVLQRNFGDQATANACLFSSVYLSRIYRNVLVPSNTERASIRMRFRITHKIFFSLGSTLILFLFLGPDLGRLSSACWLIPLDFFFFFNFYFFAVHT